jgi:tRNA1Val (adenine37-N6)-methyltransferase
MDPTGHAGLGPLSDDAFLCGRLRLWQPVSGYRAATDPVLLAAACPARAGQSVLDLGCGAGAAALCLGARVAGLALAGLEVQAGYAVLARANAARNGVAFEVHEGDVADEPPALRRGFEHVIANPPYYAAGGTPSADGGRDTALRAQQPLRLWTESARRRLHPGGWLTLILGADRLGEALAALEGRMGSVAILPLMAREGREAVRVLIRARKGGRARLRLLSPMVLHEGPAHAGNREDYTPEARAVLREIAAIRRFD